MCCWKFAYNPKTMTTITFATICGIQSNQTFGFSHVHIAEVQQDSAVSSHFSYHTVNQGPSWSLLSAILLLSLFLGVTYPFKPQSYPEQWFAGT